VISTTITQIPSILSDFIEFVIQRFGGFGYSSPLEYPFELGQHLVPIAKGPLANHEFTPLAAGHI
jgi:hypothetical protein